MNSKTQEALENLTYEDSVKALDDIKKEYEQVVGSADLEHVAYPQFLMNTLFANIMDGSQEAAQYIVAAMLRYEAGPEKEVPNA